MYETSSGQRKDEDRVCEGVKERPERLEPQRDALLANGCERVFEEKISSGEAYRGALRETFDYYREGDVLVVARLDRAIFAVYGWLEDIPDEDILKNLLTSNLKRSGQAAQVGS